jgi:hypothetical protein
MDIASLVINPRIMREIAALAETGRVRHRRRPAAHHCRGGGAESWKGGIDA